MEETGPRFPALLVAIAPRVHGRVDMMGGGMGPSMSERHWSCTSIAKVWVQGGSPHALVYSAQIALGLMKFGAPRCAGDPRHDVVSQFSHCNPHWMRRVEH